MIEWSIRALAAAETIGAIVIAAPPGFLVEVEVVADRSSTKPVEVVAGGASRAESVMLALEAVAGDLVAILDAARPLVTPELIDRVVARLAASDADGVIAAAPVTDTLKRAGEGDAVTETLDRAGLWGAQTPQAFRVEALKTAQASARQAGDLEAATDEAWLIERAVGVVLLEAAGAPNMKVTDARDLELAAALLSAAGR